MTTAVLEDIVPSPGEHIDRAEIIQYIEAHLREPDLGPPSIASAFGISLRWVHHLFSHDGQSIARYITNRRLDLVTAQLQTNHRFPRITPLAAQHGFASRERLTRAFKTRYAMPIADYAALAASGHAPEPLNPLEPL